MTRKNAAFIYAKATKENFGTIIAERPHGARPHATTTLKNIVGPLPDFARTSTTAAALFAIRQGLEYAVSIAGEHGFAAANVFSDMKSVTDTWKNHAAFWQHTGRLLIKGGKETKQLEAWRPIMALHEVLPLNFARASVTGSGHEAMMMRMADDLARRYGAEEGEAACNPTSC